MSDPDLAFRTFRTLERLGAVLYVQRFIPHGGWDVRVLVFDGEILGAIRRRNDNDFRVNIARQATAEAYPLHNRERELASRAAAATGVRFCGVDLLYDRQGNCYVIEVNAIPGWQAFSRVTGIDVAAEVISRLERHVAQKSPAVSIRGAAMS